MSNEGLARSERIAVGGLDRVNLELEELNKVLKELLHVAKGVCDILEQHCPEASRRARELRERRSPESTRRA